MQTTLPLDPQSPAFGLPAMPEWVKGFRDHQVVGIEETLYSLANGARVVLVNAPTGSGKTLLAEAVRRLHPASHALYVATTKTLQDQFAADFPYAKVLKGRRNYPTLDFPELFDDPFKPLTAADCTKDRVSLPACSGCPESSETDTAVLHCENCHPWYQCPYEQAKMQALQADIAVTNTAFFLGEANGAGRLSKQQLVIVDECDTLESILMGQVEVVVSERVRKKHGLGFPSKKTVETAWIDWVVSDAVPILGKAMMEADQKLRHHRTRDNVKEAQNLQRLFSRLKRMEEQITSAEGLDWIYDSAAQKEGRVVFRPVKVDGIGEEMLWKHSNQWVVMSASIVDPVEFTESLGLKAGWDLVNVPNTFPKENRPIHVVPVTSMARKNEVETEGRNIATMAEAIAKIMRKHEGERILVHTVSYKLAQQLFDLLRVDEELRSRLVVYGDANDREPALDLFKSKVGAVALAPSWDRGVDLPGDLCTVQVIAKIPFPNLGDKQVNKRLYGTRDGQQWFAVQTVRTIIQMLGRGVRSKDDKCVTYILDRQFMSNIWSKSRMLIPAYIKEAVSFEGGVL